MPSRIDKNTAGLIALLLGGLGIHRFYVGDIGWGIIYLLFCWTFVPAIVGFIDALVWFSGSQTNFDNSYNKEFLTYQNREREKKKKEKEEEKREQEYQYARQMDLKKSDDPSEQIRKAKQLVDDGILSEEEFAALKKKVLGI